MKLIHSIPPSLYAAAILIAVSGTSKLYAQNSKVDPIPLGKALTVSLDNYYDLLEKQVGSLTSNEKIQIKLVADPVDISSTKYQYWSHYNLLNRCDVTIEPDPVSAAVYISSAKLHRTYERFLIRLSGFVIIKNLSKKDQDEIADIRVQILDNKKRRNELWSMERQWWNEYCEITGTDKGDQDSYLLWSSNNGNVDVIDRLNSDLNILQFREVKILDRKWDDPEDKQIVNAYTDFINPRMRLRYPLYPDYHYKGYATWNLGTLANFSAGADGRFDDRRSISWNVAIKSMESKKIGGFDTAFDTNTQESTSIKKNWGYSGSASYGLFSVKAGGSGTKQIKEDFSKVETINLKSEAAFRAGIAYPGWFRADLFDHPRVVENLSDFKEFFGPNGSLLYYPTGIILVRGFSVRFTSSQNWEYDYKKQFSASAGGGFRAFGFKFGSKGSYGETKKVHKVDSSGTTLSFSDDVSTLRFVGYTVKKNTVWEKRDHLIVPKDLPISEPGPSVKAIKTYVTPDSTDTE